MVSGKELKVRLRKQEVVAAVLPVQEHWLPMSNLDLLLPPLDVGVFMCYKKPAAANSMNMNMNMIGMLKKALVQALVSFYALAGEVVTNSIGEPELLCNNRGVDFAEAYADIQLEQLNLYDADNTIQGKLIPNKKQGVMAVQVTEFQCGGLVVACTWDHRVADAYSANMFIVSWGGIAASAAADEDSKSLLCGLQPSFRRSLLNPRRPAIIDPSVDHFFIPLNMLPPPPPPQSDHEHQRDRLVSRIYSVSADEVKRLQSEASTDSCKRSKLVSFCAFLWKTIAKSAVPGKQCKLGIAVDGRTRLSISLSGPGDHAPNLLDSYFGNVLSIPYGSKAAVELIGKPLWWVAEAVHEFLDVATTREHFLGLIDWAEAHRPVTSMAKIYSKGIEDGPAFVVSSGEWFPLSEVDFGWGKPLFWSYSFHWEGDTGYVMPMHSPKGNGDWVVYMRLLKGQLDLVEKQAAHVLRPFTF